MQVYLPIAEMSANMLVFVSLGFSVGFVSSLFSIGGAFLMTPLLIFSGIAPAVAVGTEAVQIAATSVSGAVLQWRRNNVDLKLTAVMLAGGLLAAVLGVQVVKSLRQAGQFEFFLPLSYIVFLGIIGSLMFAESVRTLRGSQPDKLASVRRPGQHVWIHKLPAKLRFHRSKLYISAIPPFVVGALGGLLAATMGVGGGFIMVPAMIYLLRVPTNIAVGTSLVQVLCVTAFTAVLQATQNRTVDIMLALLLMIGGGIGARYGAAAGQRVKGEKLRILLATFILLVGARFAVDLFAPPHEIYSATSGIGGRR